MSDHFLWLIERYGYARREGSHQGHPSAHWFAAIKDMVAIQEEALESVLFSFDQVSKHEGHRAALMRFCAAKAQAREALAAMKGESVRERRRCHEPG